MKIATIILITGLALNALACEEHNLNQGDRAIDDRGYIVTVQEVFGSGKAIVAYNNATYPYDVSKLSKGVRCLKNICVNDRVIHYSGTVGTVKGVFLNGKASVASSNGLFEQIATYDVSDLSKSTN